jgi:hypothetical protein
VFSTCFVYPPLGSGWSELGYVISFSFDKNFLFAEKSIRKEKEIFNDKNKTQGNGTTGGFCITGDFGGPGLNFINKKRKGTMNRQACLLGGLHRQFFTIAWLELTTAN